MIDIFFLVSDRNVLAMPHAFGQFIDYPDRIFSFEHGINKRHTGREKLLRFITLVPLGPFFNMVVTFQITGLGQQDICPHGDIRGCDIGDHDKIHVGKGLFGPLLARHGLDGVGAPDNKRLDGIGFAGDHGVPHQLRRGSRGPEGIFFHYFGQGHFLGILFVINFGPVDMA